MNPLIRENQYSGLRHHAKVHSFRILTVILAWVFIAAAFYKKPELLTWIQRAIQGGMEIVGDNIPPPWGPRIEFVFREIGGFIWLQITLIVVALRVLLSWIAAFGVYSGEATHLCEGSPVYPGRFAFFNEYRKLWKVGSREGSDKVGRYTGRHRPKMLTGLLASRAKVSQTFTVRESVNDYRYAAAFIAIALRMSATNSR